MSSPDPLSHAKKQLAQLTELTLDLPGTMEKALQEVKDSYSKKIMEMHKEKESMSQLAKKYIDKAENLERENETLRKNKIDLEKANQELRARLLKLEASQTQGPQTEPPHTQKTPAEASATQPSPAPVQPPKGSITPSYSSSTPSSTSSASSYSSASKGDQEKHKHKSDTEKATSDTVDPKILGNIKKHLDDSGRLRISNIYSLGWFPTRDEFEALLTILKNNLLSIEALSFFTDNNGGTLKKGDLVKLADALKTNQTLKDLSIAGGNEAYYFNDAEVKALADLFKINNVINSLAVPFSTDRRGRTSIVDTNALKYFQEGLKDNTTIRTLLFADKPDEHFEALLEQNHKLFAGKTTKKI